MITRFDIEICGDFYNNIDFKKLNIISQLELPFLICDNFYLFPIKFIKHFYDIFVGIQDSNDIIITHRLLHKFENKIEIKYIRNEHCEVPELTFYKIHRSYNRPKKYIKIIHFVNFNNTTSIEYMYKPIKISIISYYGKYNYKIDLIHLDLKNINLEQINFSNSIFIWIGPGIEIIESKIKILKEDNYLIFYQTEPEISYNSKNYNLFDEIWDYSLHNYNTNSDFLEKNKIIGKFARQVDQQ